MDVEAATWVRDWALSRLPGAVLWGGTLLGEVREGRILPWDTDVDIAVPADNFRPLQPDERRRADWEPWFNLHVPEQPHGNVGYTVRGVRLGIHLVSVAGGWGYYTRYPGQLVRVPDPFPPVGVLPADAPRILDWLYGDWQTQHKNYIGSHAHRANQKRWLVLKPETVYTDGVFDLFHEGHRRLLERARGYGNRLVVGVKTDDAAEAMKGRRPVDPLPVRIRNVSRHADKVVPYADSEIRGDVFVHGDTWHERDRSGLVAEAENKGVPIVLLPRTPGISTSLLRKHPR